MTNEFPASDGAFSPLGSLVLPKSRIERYFASFFAAVVRAMPIGDAVRMPRPAACKSFACGARLRRNERLGLQGLAGAPLCRHAGAALARSRIAYVRRARDQRFVLHADQTRDLRAVAYGDARWLQ